MVGSPGNQPPSWGGIQKSPFLKLFQELRRRDQISHCSCRSGNSKGLGICEPGTVDEEQIYMRNIYIYTWSSEWPNICIYFPINLCHTRKSQSLLLPYFLEEPASLRVQPLPQITFIFKSVVACEPRVPREPEKGYIEVLIKQWVWRGLRTRQGGLQGWRPPTWRVWGRNLRIQQWVPA